METGEKNRKQYKKPQVSQIKLETEEAVLTACKTETTGGGKNVSSGACTTGTTGRYCQTNLGS